MRKLLPLAVLLGFALGCAPAPSAPNPTATAPLEPGRAAEAIAVAQAFREPIYLEVWSRGPTAERLEAAGYLRLAQSGGNRIELTDKAEAIGAKEDYFQDDIPVYWFPVGRREVLEITEIGEDPRAGSLKRVEFSYRKQPTDLGRYLLEAGGILRDLESKRVTAGRAIFVPEGDGWRIATLEL